MKLLNSGFDNNFTYFECNLTSSEIPIVFIHGVGLDNTMWMPQKKYFKNDQTIFYDLLNHGQSKKGYKNLNFKDFSFQLNNLLNFLNINKCILVGFSIGSLIAQHFAEEFYNKVNKLIIIGSVYKRTNEQINTVKNRYKKVMEGKNIENESINRWFNQEYLQKHPEVFNYFLSILQKKKNSDFLPAYKVFVEADKYILDFSKLVMPTLIMTGENEVGSTPSMSKMLQREIKNSKIFIIPKAKHMATFETADVVNLLIAKFIKNNNI